MNWNDKNNKITETWTKIKVKTEYIKIKINLKWIKICNNVYKISQLRIKCKMELFPFPQQTEMFLDHKHMALSQCWYSPCSARIGCTGKTPRGPRCTRVNCSWRGSRTGSWAGLTEPPVSERSGSWEPCLCWAPNHPSTERGQNHSEAGVALHPDSTAPSPEEKNNTTL